MARNLPRLYQIKIWRLFYKIFKNFHHLVATTLLTTFQVSAKFENIQKVQPSLNLDPKLGFSNSIFDKFKEEEKLKKEVLYFRTD